MRSNAGFIGWFIHLAAGFVFLTAAIGLSNWILGRKSAFPFESDVTMKTNTAIGLLCLAVAVVCIWSRSRPRLIWVGRGLAYFASLIGLATLVQHLFRIDLGIDQLLFQELPGAPATVSPNRMGPPTSVIFLVLGQLIGWLPANGRLGRNIQWLALVTLAIAIVPLTGFFFGATDLYAISRLTGIAPHTALSLSLLSICALLLRPERAPVELLFRQDAGGEIARRLIPAAIFLPPLVGLLVVKGREANLFEVPMARVIMQICTVTPLLVMVWWTARHLSSIAQSRDRAQRNFDVARERASELADQNLQTMNLLDQLLDNAPVGFAAFDRSYRYVRVNKYLSHLSIYPIANFVGHTLRELYPTYADQFEGLIQRVFDTGQPIQKIETSAEAEGVEARHFTCELFPVPGPSGTTSLVGMLVTEVTDRKRMDAQRAALLESERHARVESERAGLMKDEFLATLSHELRTPLTSIVGWSQILRRKTPEPKDLDRGLETIDRNGKALSQLINDLLDVSRIINGKLHLNMLQVNTQSIVGAAIDSVSPVADAKGVTLTRDLDPDPLPVQADPARIQQVVWNLLTNAVKFTPRGGKVHIAVRRADQQVQIVVSDTGVGVKPEFLPYMFERFRQADASTTRRFGGLGLGLSIVRQLTELHGGSVHVTSDGPDRGATFTVALPLAAQIASSPEPEPSPESELGLLEGVRILVVDDEADTRDLVARIIEQTGATVTSAASADEAILRVQMDRPQLLISDIGMPDRDGYDLIRQLRSHLGPRELPAVALTAFARPEDRDRSFSAGFQLHIRKPVSPQELVDAIASLVTVSGRRR